MRLGNHHIEKGSNAWLSEVHSSPLTYWSFLWTLIPAIDMKNMNTCKIKSSYTHLHLYTNYTTINLYPMEDVGFMSWLTWSWLWVTCCSCHVWLRRLQAMGHSCHVTIMCALHFRLFFFIRNPHAHTYHTLGHCLRETRIYNAMIG